MTLLEQIVKRNQAAFAEVYDRHSRPVAWLAHSLVPGHLTDDVIQATFISLWDSSHRITISGESLLPWLMGACRIHSKAILRKEHRHRHEATDPAMAGGNVEDEALHRHLIAAIDAHISSLGGLDQRIYRLCIHEDLSYEAAAEQLGITSSTLRNRLSRLRAGVRRRFGSD
ncbi:sigma-70 family RNA polymerase sigma factor [Arthrobacter sp. UYCu712]|uniref:RNA polymerase sigma factor n=1 Tax=Arthrobacter sp. UYCu712 TaxID=3156340 RepID=UPI0033984C2D